MNILEDEIRTFIAVLLLPGYWKVPYRNLYWANAPDTQNEAVSCAMSRNIFWEILSNLHLAENKQITEIDTTKYEHYLKSWILVSNSMLQLLITALMKPLSLTMENAAQNNLLDKSPLGLGLNFNASPPLKDMSFMQKHIVELILFCQIQVWVRVQMLCWVWLKSVRYKLDQLLHLTICLPHSHY